MPQNSPVSNRLESCFQISRLLVRESSISCRVASKFGSSMPREVVASDHRPDFAYRRNLPSRPWIESPLRCAEVGSEPSIAEISSGSTTSPMTLREIRKSSRAPTIQWDSFLRQATRKRLSCRPPAEEGSQPTTTFYSRASPVNCGRWLGDSPTDDVVAVSSCWPKLPKSQGSGKRQ